MEIKESNIIIKQNIKKKDKSSKFNYLVNNLNTEKNESEKIKLLILLEKESINFLNVIKEHTSIIKILFEFLTNCLNEIEAHSSNILKGQILISATSILILINAKANFIDVFLNFINNILIEYLKDINNIQNLYLREVSCHCLEELEVEYPGILINLLGNKFKDITSDNDNLYKSNKQNGNANHNDKIISLESKYFN